MRRDDGSTGARVANSMLRAADEFDERRSAESFARTGVFKSARVSTRDRETSCVGFSGVGTGGLWLLPCRTRRRARKRESPRAF